MAEIALNCPADVTTQVLQGNTNILVNYDIPSATTSCLSDGLSLVRTSGPASGTVLAPGTYIVNFQATDNCFNSESCSFNIVVEPASTNPPGDYCSSNSSQPWQEWISEVEIGSISNSTGKCGPDDCGYSDYTNISTNLNKDNSHEIQLVPGLSWNGYSPDLYWRVWIDFNQDGDFGDAGELVLEDNPGNQSIDDSIFIPNSANEGSTRMRVSMKKDGFPTSCESFVEGEVEDYAINITINEPPAPTDYCESAGDLPWSEWIERVELGTIDNSTGKCTPTDCGYGDFTAESTNISAGSNPTITLSPGLSYVGYRPDLYWRVWIDLNQDGDFTDNGENVYQEFNDTGTEVVGNLAIPNTATIGSTRMRISVSRDTYVDPCDQFNRGEVEDYTVVITNGSSTSGIYLDPGQEILFLRGVTNEAGIQLNWTTNTDFKNDFFAIGRSFDGVNFKAIEHKDAFGFKGIVYYQIQAIHLNGGRTYSNIIKINNRKSEDQMLLFPNPAQDEVRVDLSTYAGQSATVQIHDPFGHQVTKMEVAELTLQPLHFDLQNLPEGTYSLTAFIEDHKPLSRLLIIIKK